MGTLYTKQLFLRTMIYTYTYPYANRYILTEEDISNKGDTILEVGSWDTYK